MYDTWLYIVRELYTTAWQAGSHTAGPKPLEYIPDIQTHTVVLFLLTCQDNVAGDITLKDIEFRYPTRPDVEVLGGTTITASRGQTIALVGQSGCGKSTSVSLLERFYDPLAGSVVRTYYILEAFGGYRGYLSL